MLNADWIQTVEPTPDTLITLTTGFKLMVRESVEDVVHAFKMYKRSHQGPNVKRPEDNYGN